MSVLAKTKQIDPVLLRNDFPILKRKIGEKELVYLDNAATTQKPQSVIDAELKYYLQSNANVHRGIHTLAEEATTAYEATRDRVRAFINAGFREEIVFTRGTTESINLVAQGWGRKFLQKGDRIIITRMEHHANLVPWIQLAQEKELELEYIEIHEDGTLDLDSYEKILTANTKLVAITHMSNVLGTINPVKLIAEKAHAFGAIVLVDGAQSTPHMSVDVADLGVDFFAFSAHKMIGPTGVGLLYGKKELFEVMDPWQFGGEMISLVRWDRATWAELPHKFEAGTPNIAGVVAFSSALDYLENLSMEAIREHEKEWTQVALSKLQDLDFIKIFGPLAVEVRGSAISFKVEGVHPHDLSQFLDSDAVAVRAGHHCAQPLTKLLGETSTTRASGYFYNTEEEIDRLVEALKKAKEYFLF
jgi:cysteine desulfurase/selenocysteine lyase